MFPLRTLSAVARQVPKKVTKVNNFRDLLFAFFAKVEVFFFVFQMPPSQVAAVLAGQRFLSTTPLLKAVAGKKFAYLAKKRGDSLVAGFEGVMF